MVKLKLLKPGKGGLRSYRAEKGQLAKAAIKLGLAKSTISSRLALKKKQVNADGRRHSFRVTINGKTRHNPKRLELGTAKRIKAHEIPMPDTVTRRHPKRVAAQKAAFKSRMRAAAGL